MAITVPLSHTPVAGESIPSSWGLEVNANFIEVSKRGFGIPCVDIDVDLATGDGQGYSTPMPSFFNGYNVTTFIADVYVKSSSGAITIVLARGRRASGTAALAWVNVGTATIDANEYSSRHGTIALDTAQDDVATGDIFRVDCDGAGTGADGLSVTVELGVP